MYLLNLDFGLQPVPLNHFVLDNESKECAPQLHPSANIVIGFPLAPCTAQTGFKKIMEDTCARYGGEEIHVGCFSDDWKQHLETLDQVVEY